MLFVGTKPLLLGLISNPAGSVDIMDIFIWRVLGKLSKRTEQTGCLGTVPSPCADSALTAGSLSNV